MRKLTGVVAIMLAGLTAGYADNYPSHPITIIAPTTAGGPPDTIARLMSERMRQSLGQPVIVENVTGAGSTIGVARVARSAPDGYTVGIGHLNSHVFSSLTYNVNYDVLKDLAPVTMLTSAPMLVAGRIGLPPNDMKELIAWSKSHPATFGSVGLGGPARVWAADFVPKTGVDWQFVPYRGAAAVMQDMISGQIDLTCTEASNVLPHYRAGKVKAYAVLSKERWEKATDIPTLEETGAPGFGMTFWHGLWVPRGTPRDVIDKLAAAARDALADPTVQARLSQMGQSIVPRAQQTPEALGAYHKAEIDKWSVVIKAANIKAQ